MNCKYYVRHFIEFETKCNDDGLHNSPTNLFHLLLLDKEESNSLFFFLSFGRFQCVWATGDFVCACMWIVVWLRFLDDVFVFIQMTAFIWAGRSCIWRLNLIECLLLLLFLVSPFTIIVPHICQTKPSTLLIPSSWCVFTLGYTWALVHISIIIYLYRMIHILYYSMIDTTTAARVYVHVCVIYAYYMFVFGLPSFRKLPSSVTYQFRIIISNIKTNFSIHTHVLIPIPMCITVAMSA